VRTAVRRGRPRGPSAFASLVLASLAVCAGRAGAQSIDERTDTPARGMVRLTFDPQILTWDETYGLSGAATPLGAGLSGDTIGAANIPYVATLQQQIRTASGIPSFIASIGQGMLAVYREQRITPGRAEVGVTNRFSIGLTVPLVRTATRTAYQIGPQGANLGPNPLGTIAGASAQYGTFFSQFGGALTQLGDSLAGGHYGCPGSPACVQGQQLLSEGQAVYAALHGIIYGVGAPGSPGSPFVPRATSQAGAGIDSTVSGLERSLTNYDVAGFTSPLLLATDSIRDTAGVGTFESPLLTDPTYGFGYEPFRDTYRYGLGNIELEGKYRVIDRGGYRLALAAIARLPTATRDTTIEVIDAPIDELGGGFEGRVLQEITMGGLWLNIEVRAGTQDLGTRSRRVAPFGSILVPSQATSTLNWQGGSYAELDVAPLYHLAPEVAAGFTLRYWTKASDHYSYQSATDSTALATNLGIPLPASLLDVGTSERSLSLGFAVSYIGPVVEGDFSVEKSLSGSGGLVPVATVYQLVFRVTQKLF